MQYTCILPYHNVFAASFLRQRTYILTQSRRPRKKFCSHFALLFFQLWTLLPLLLFFDTDLWVQQQNWSRSSVNMMAPLGTSRATPWDLYPPLLVYDQYFCDEQSRTGPLPPTIIRKRTSSWRMEHPPRWTHQPRQVLWRKCSKRAKEESGIVVSQQDLIPSKNQTYPCTSIWIMEYVTLETEITRAQAPTRRSRPICLEILWGNHGWKLQNPETWCIGTHEFDMIHCMRSVLGAMHHNGHLLTSVALPHMVAGCRTPYHSLLSLYGTNNGHWYSTSVSNEDLS